jgi:hypothetical protein
MLSPSRRSRPRISDRRAIAIARAVEILSFDKGRDPFSLFGLTPSDARAVRDAIEYLRDLSEWHRQRAAAGKKEPRP